MDCGSCSSNSADKTKSSRTRLAQLRGAFEIGRNDRGVLCPQRCDLLAGAAGAKVARALASCLGNVRAMTPAGMMVSRLM